MKQIAATLLLMTSVLGAGCFGSSGKATGTDAEVGCPPGYVCHPADVAGGADAAVSDALSSMDVPTDSGPKPLGAPCSFHAECASEWCLVLAPPGGVCATPADPRWRACDTCAEDDHCAGKPCVTIDGESRCLEPCDRLKACYPDGFECMGHPQVAGTWCLPETGSCSCMLGVNGGYRSCFYENEFGTCAGIQACDPAAGWGECTAMQASPEDCDGLDNDCNGLVDDSVPAGASCQLENEHGVCPGVLMCLGSSGWLCHGIAPAPETCDSLDNNCDGVTDEAFRDADGFWTLDEHCGSCDNDCTALFPDEGGQCAGPPSQPMCVPACLPPCELVGYLQPQCLCPSQPADCEPCTDDSECFGGQCYPYQGEALVCLMPCGLDGSCALEGYHCEEVEPGWEACVPDTASCSCTLEQDGQKQTCYDENEAGICYGVRSCDGETGWGPCSAPQPTVEDCDGLDNDCNGLIDEDLWQAGTSCVNTIDGIGSCEGVWACAAEQGWVCVGETPQSELCDLLDNDCDGSIDEDFRDELGFWTLQAHCGFCFNDCTDKFANGTGKCGGTQEVPVCQVDTCDSGYVEVNPFSCVPPPDTSCWPCQGASDCFGGSCVTLDGENVCAAPCAVPADCGADYECVDTGSGETRCLPLSGSCSCHSGTDGQQRECWNNNAFGSCQGIETCQAGLGWASCTAPEAAAESCDYADNDCDYEVDESFVDAAGLYVHDEHCGQCGSSCLGSIAYASATCEVAAGLPTCVVDDCETGYAQLDATTCAPITVGLCAGCSDPGDCPLLGAACATLSNGDFCLNPCDEPADCPSPGFTCAAGAGGSFCTPDGDQCPP